VGKVGVTFISYVVGDGSSTRPLMRDGGMEEFCGDPTVGSCFKVCTRDQRLKK